MGLASSQVCDIQRREWNSWSGEVRTGDTKPLFPVTSLAAARVGGSSRRAFETRESGGIVGWTLREISERSSIERCVLRRCS